MVTDSWITSVLIQISDQIANASIDVHEEIVLRSEYITTNFGVGSGLFGLKFFVPPRENLETNRLEDFEKMIYFRGGCVL